MTVIDQYLAGELDAEILRVQPSDIYQSALVGLVEAVNERRGDGFQLTVHEYSMYMQVVSILKTWMEK